MAKGVDVGVLIESGSLPPEGVLVALIVAVAVGGGV